MPTPDSYCDPAEVKASTPDLDFGSTYDAILATLCLRASRAIDRFSSLPPGGYKVTADATLYFTGDNSKELWVTLAQAPTTVEVAESGDLSDYTAWTASDYLLWPFNAPTLGEPYRRLDIYAFGTKIYWPKYPKAIKITGRLGYSIAPPDLIVEATIIQTARWFKRGQQAWADTGAITELGQLKYTKNLDPDVAEIIAHFGTMTV